MTTTPTPDRYDVADYTSKTDPRRMATIRDIHVGSNLTVTAEDEARNLIAKLTAWLDAPRLAARDHLTGIVPVACCYSTGVALIQSRAGEWGVVDTDWLSMAPDIGLESTGAMRDWYATEAEARAAYRDETGKVICESCARFLDHTEACVDTAGIYTCADETACSAACAAKEHK